jgi:hypothetical protein
MEMRVGCFCPPEIFEWARVEVVGGQVIRVVLGSGEEITEGYRLAWWDTVDQLFEQLAGYVGDSKEYLKDVRFRFDADLGYPTEINLIAHENIADGGSTVYLRNLAPFTPEAAGGPAAPVAGASPAPR